jgi:hypothetical protein
MITIVVLALMGPGSFLVFDWAIHETRISGRSSREAIQEHQRLGPIIANQSTGRQ